MLYPVSWCCFLPLRFLFSSHGLSRPCHSPLFVSLSVSRPPALDSPIHNYRVYHSRLRNLHYRAAPLVRRAGSKSCNAIIKESITLSPRISLTGKIRRASTVIVPIPIVSANRISGCFSRLLRRRYFKGSSSEPRPEFRRRERLAAKKFGTRVKIYSAAPYTYTYKYEICNQVVSTNCVTRDRRIRH